MSTTANGNLAHVGLGNANGDSTHTGLRDRSNNFKLAMANASITMPNQDMPLISRDISILQKHNKMGEKLMRLKPRATREKFE